MESLPFVTLIMPVRNEGGFIRRSLGAVLAQDYPHRLMEILIVDGMSTDETRPVVLAANAEPASLRLIDNPGRIVPTGLNLALATARGEVIVRVDGHCEIAPDYVTRCVHHLQNGFDGVGGPIETIGETGTAQTIALAMSTPFGVGGSSFRTVTDRALLADTVAFPAYTRQAIEKAGSYDEELVRNQDDEYNYRLRKLGGRLLLAPDIRSRYYSRSSLRSLSRQFFQYGYWKVRVMQKHWGQMRARQFMPALLITVLGVTLLLSPVVSFAGWLSLLIAATYLGLNLAASLKAATVRQWRRVPLLSLCFTTLHFSYGSGFLLGLLSFWNRWGSETSNPVALSYKCVPPEREESANI